MPCGFLNARLRPLTQERFDFVFDPGGNARGLALATRAGQKSFEYHRFAAIAENHLAHFKRGPAQFGQRRLHCQEVAEPGWTPV